ncbi:MAG: hypothetical protein IKA88_00340 [Clostridia bacterium]|nr:hypothetical protein [Clostridia bacterium]
MKKSMKKVLATLCAVCTLGAIGTGITFATAASQNGESASVVDEVVANSTYYVEQNSVNASTATYGNFEDIASISKTNGIITNLYPKDKLVLRNVIDLRERDSEDLLIATTAVPTSLGAPDVQRIRYEIVDAYDPTNYVTVDIKPHRDEKQLMTTGYANIWASNGQKPTAVDRGGTYVHVDNYWGTWTRFSFSGAPEPHYNLDKSVFGISFDIQTNIVYLYDSLTNEFLPIADLDNKDHFGLNLWEGFTTGEVYFKVYATTYEKETAQLFITKYDNYDLSRREIVDGQGPTIMVDYGEYTQESYPEAVVGYKYQLFNAWAFDVYTGEADVEMKVYLDYGSQNPKQQFFDKRTLEWTPTVAGIYTVLYESKDANGNVTQKAVNIQCKREAEVEVLALMLGSYADSVAIASNVMLPSTQITGAIGNAKLSVTATLNGQPLEITNNTVFVAKTGTLKVVYDLSDYSGRKTQEVIEITVKTTNKPSFVETPILPEFFVEGNSYKLPVISAYNYVDGSGKALPTVIKVKKAGESTATTINGTYVPTVSTHKELVEIIYEATINGESATWSKFVPVYKTRQDNKLDMSKYFESANGTVTAKRDWVQFDATEDAAFTFVNSIYSTSMSLDFSLLASAKNIGKLNIYLTDYYDLSNQICFTYTVKNGVTVFYANQKEDTALEVSTAFKADASFNLNYDNLTATAKYDIANNNTITIAKNLQDKPFNGFKGQEYYLTIELEGVKNNDAALALKKINGHFFSSDDKEYSQPTITFDGDYGAEMKVGATSVLPNAYVFDVLDGKMETKLTVIAPDGSFVTSLDGVALQSIVLGNETISFKLDSYGKYQVFYIASDRSGNKRTFSYSIRVIDTQSPVIELKYTIQEAAKLGDNVYLPSFEIQDNKSDSANIVSGILIIAPNGKLKEFNRKNNVGFVASMVGDYRVMYYAYDEEGNQSVKVFTIKVTEA